MKKETAVDRIAGRYGETAHLDKPRIRAIIESGVSMGLSVRKCYNALRMILGLLHETRELFTEKEAQELFEISAEHGFFEVLESLTLELKRTVYLFPDI